MSLLLLFNQGGPPPANNNLYCVLTTREVSGFLRTQNPSGRMAENSITGNLVEIISGEISSRTVTGKLELKK